MSAARRARLGERMYQAMAIGFTLILAAGAPSGAAARMLSTDRPGNVFVEGQPVRVMLAPGEPADLVVRDLDGREVARRAVTAHSAAEALDLGRLPAGYYEAAVGASVLPLVVVVDPSTRVPGESRLATDNAMSWLVNPDQFPDVAELLRLAGFGWVRERLSWGEVERERGRFEWGRYEASAAHLSQRGIRVYQVFHGSPAWSREDRDGRAAPDDLRDIYRFARALARQFRGRVHAWEVWNEPDIDFFSHTASECAAFQKAAFLGFRAEDPTVQVLGPSMALPAGAFAEHLLLNGTGHYLDVWNYHIYADPSAYAQRHEGFQALLARHRVAAPSWVTEAGDPVRGPEGILTRESRVHQAAFISRAFAQALAAGIDRHFWFIFPFYREGETGWGVFEPDQRAPYPGLAALATATYALGRGDYLGRLVLSDRDARALAFARGDGTAALVVWREADAPAEVALPLEWTQLRDARTHLGTPVPAGSGTVSLSVARAAVYVIVPANALRGKLTRPPARPRVRPAAQPGLPQVVTRLRVTGARVDKGADCYVVPAGQQVQVFAETYNFGETPFSGRLALSAPDGWSLDRKAVPVAVAPGERSVVPLRLTVPAFFGQAEVRLTAASGRKQSTPAILSLQVDPNTAQPKAVEPLDLGRAERWEKNIAGNGTMEIAPGTEGGVRFAFSFAAAGDNWAYPSARCEPALDLSAYNALRFEYRTSTDDSGPVRLMLVEPGGPTYFTSGGLPGSTQWRTATIPLNSLAHLSLSSPDANGKLDLDRIAIVRIGANCKPLQLTLEVRNVQAVRL